MKLKSVLLASVAVLFAGSASAADLTSPFFVPSQGKMTSDTKVQYGRTHVDNGIYDNLYASEELAYGITNNLAVFGTIGNHFDIEKEFNNSHNFDYEIGAKYNHNFGNVKITILSIRNLGMATEQMLVGRSSSTVKLKSVTIWAVV